MIATTIMSRSRRSSPALVAAPLCAFVLLPLLAGGAAASGDGTKDDDFDGLTNGQELSIGTRLSAFDSDGDGLGDGDEVNVFWTSPLAYDTDGDGESDGDEILFGGDPLTPEPAYPISSAPGPASSGGPDGGPTYWLDEDGDGLTSGEEIYIYGTWPFVWDSDGDGAGDGKEVFQGTNPLVFEIYA